MKGKSCVVTGATSGIGRALCEALVARGAIVWAIGRDPRKAEALEREVRSRHPDARLSTALADLSAVQDTRRLGLRLRAELPRLDVLVNNAGAIFQTRHVTTEGLERTFALNHLAYFQLTRLLLPSLHAAPHGRIVNVASRAHRRGRMHWDDLQLASGYRAWRAYDQSKLANLLFTRELARRLKGTNVTANAVHPGVVASEFAQNEPGPWRWAYAWARPLLRTPEAAAESVLRLCEAPELEGRSGEYFEHDQPATPSRRARSDADASRLWELSERLVPEVA